MATTQEMLDEAIATRHKIMLGKAVSSISGAGEAVSYTRADLPALNAYIAELQRKITGTSPSRGRIAYVVPH